MAIKDWDIKITDNSRPVPQSSFSRVLIATTEKDFGEKLFTTFDDISDEFDSDSDVYKISTAIFGQNPSVSEVVVVGVETQDEAELVKAISDVDLDFFFVVTNEQEEVFVKAIADYIEGTHKMYGVTTDSEDVIDSLHEGEYDNTFYVVHNTPESYACEAWIGRCGAESPGSITWNFKPVSGIGLSNKESERVRDKNGNSSIEYHGQQYMFDGRVASGQWIDVIQSQHYVYQKVNEEVFSALINNPKIPYDNTGISVIEGAIENALKSAANNGIIAMEDNEYMFDVSTPDRSDMSKNDRVNRILKDVKANFIIAGAIHGGEVEITVSV